MQGQWLPAPSVLLNDNGSRNYWSVYNTAEQNAAASYPRLSHQGGEYNNYKMSDYWLKSSACLLYTSLLGKYLCRLGRRCL